MGITKENTVTDKASGKDFDRPGFQKLMGLLEPGDLVVCKSLDRLGRDVREVQKVINEITYVKEAGIAFIDMPQLNCNIDASASGYMIATIMQVVQSYAAQLERYMILTRTAEGRRIAKKKGIKFGRPLKEPTGEFWSLLNSITSGKLSVRQAEKELSVNHRTLKRWIRIARVKEARERIDDGIKWMDAIMKEWEDASPGNFLGTDMEKKNELFECRRSMDEASRKLRDYVPDTRSEQGGKQGLEAEMDFVVDELEKEAKECLCRAEGLVRSMNLPMPEALVP